MFYTYILKSSVKEKYYVGHTNNLEERLLRHNSGQNTYTRLYKPWRVIYYEKFSIEQSAIDREKYFKTASGRRWLKKNVKV